MTQDKRRDELIKELMELKDGEFGYNTLGVRWQAEQIVDVFLAREQTLKHSSDILIDALKAREKLLLEKIGKLTNAISAIQMLIEEDIEERKGFTFNRKKILDIAEEALK